MYSTLAQRREAQETKQVLQQESKGRILLHEDGWVRHAGYCIAMVFVVVLVLVLALWGQGGD